MKAVEATDAEIENFIVWVHKLVQLKDGEWEPVVTAILTDAGFHIEKVERMDVVGHHLDDDRRRTGRTYLWNESSRIGVMEVRRPESTHATLWLNVLWKELIADRGTGCERGIFIARSRELVRMRIAQCRPLEPILLTEHGETYMENIVNITDNRWNDKHEFRNRTGIHDHCNGSINCMIVSGTHQAFLCRKCNLRVVFPITLKTFGDLRKHFAQFQPT